jgi:hypothetical protein
MSIKDIPEEISRALCHIQVTISGKKLECLTNEDLNIDYDEIEFELEHMPQIFHAWSQLYSEAKEQTNIVEKQIRRRRGILTSEIIRDMGKSLSRGTLTDLVEIDDKLLELEAEHIRLQKIAGKLYFTLEAIKMKSDHMRSLCGFKKLEMQNS